MDSRNDTNEIVKELQGMVDHNSQLIETAKKVISDLDRFLTRSVGPNERSGNSVPASAE